MGRYIAIIKSTQKIPIYLSSRVIAVEEKRWADTLSMLMKYASDIFGSIEGFKKGRVIVEVEGDRSALKIAIWKNKDGELKLNFEFSPTTKIEEPQGETEEEMQEEEESPPEVASSEKPQVDLPMETGSLEELGDLFDMKEEKEESFDIS